LFDERRSIVEIAVETGLDLDRAQRMIDPD